MQGIDERVNVFLDRPSAGEWPSLWLDVTCLADFVTAYNFAKRLKTVKGLTPYEYICKTGTKEPARFGLDPLHQRPGLNI